MLLALQVHKVHKGRLVLQEQQVLPGQELVQQDLLVRRAHKGRLVLLELPVLKVYRGLLE